jgi:hypothetical protein
MDLGYNRTWLTEIWTGVALNFRKRFAKGTQISSGCMQAEVGWKQHIVIVQKSAGMAQFKSMLQTWTTVNSKEDSSDKTYRLDDHFFEINYYLVCFKRTALIA